MNLIELNQDLFTVERTPETYFCHCISADAKMGAGIAVPMRVEFGLIELQFEADRKPFEVGTCVEYNKVFNLITKQNYWDKPTFNSMYDCLLSLRHVVNRKGIKRIVMPTIGAGLDRLNWKDTLDTIKRLFEDIDIEIVVCYY